jgi:hypothetical protein
MGANFAFLTLNAEILGVSSYSEAESLLSLAASLRLVFGTAGVLVGP